MNKYPFSCPLSLIDVTQLRFNIWLVFESFSIFCVGHCRFLGEESTDTQKVVHFIFQVFLEYIEAEPDSWYIQVEQIA